LALISFKSQVSRFILYNKQKQADTSFYQEMHIKANDFANKTEARHEFQFEDGTWFRLAQTRFYDTLTVQKQTIDLISNCVERAIGDNSEVFLEFVFNSKNQFLVYGSGKKLEMEFYPYKRNKKSPSKVPEIKESDFTVKNLMNSREVLFTANY